MTTLSDVRALLRQSEKDCPSPRRSKKKQPFSGQNDYRAYINGLGPLDNPYANNLVTKATIVKRASGRKPPPERDPWKEFRDACNKDILSRRSEQPETITHLEGLITRVLYFTLAELKPPLDSISEMEKLAAFQIAHEVEPSDRNSNFNIYRLLNLLNPTVRDVQKLQDYPLTSEEFTQFDQNPLWRHEAREEFSLLVTKPPVKKVGVFSDWIDKIIDKKRRPTAADVCRLMGRNEGNNAAQSWHPAAYDTYKAVRDNYLDWENAPSRDGVDAQRLHSKDLMRAATLVQTHFAKIHRLRTEWEKVRPDPRCKNRRCKTCATYKCSDAGCKKCNQFGENCTNFYQRVRAELKHNKQQFDYALIKLCDDYYGNPNDEQRHAFLHFLNSCYDKLLEGDRRWVDSLTPAHSLILQCESAWPQSTGVWATKSIPDTKIKMVATHTVHFAETWKQHRENKYDVAVCGDVFQVSGNAQAQYLEEYGAAVRVKAASSAPRLATRLKRMQQNPAKETVAEDRAEIEQRSKNRLRLTKQAKKGVGDARLPTAI